jgi:hypothetical protein
MNNEPDTIPEGYLRVTDVLKPYSNFDHIDPKILAKAADRGSRAHRFCELYALNLLLCEPDDDCKNYLESFKEWFDTSVTKLLMNEKRINSEKYRLSGKFDMLVILKGDTKATILDLKTPAQTVPEWQLQTAAYRMLVQDELCVEVDRRVILKLPKEGGKAKTVEYTEHDKDEKRYLNALELYRFFHG